MNALNAIKKYAGKIETLLNLTNDPSFGYGRMYATNAKARSLPYYIPDSSGV